MNFVHRHMRSKPSFEDWLQKLKSSNWEDVNGIRSMRLEKMKCIFLFAGLEHMQNMIKLCKDKNQYSVCVY